VPSKQGDSLLRARAAFHTFTVRARQEFAVAVCLLTFGAICLDYLLAPPLNTLTPAISSGLLLLLILRRKSSPAVTNIPASSHFARWQVPLFFLLHLGIVSTVWLSHLVAGLGSLAHRTPELVLAAAKYTVLLPTVVLLPRESWLRFGRLYRAECVAAAIALFTLYPYRLFVTAWPWYSQALGHTAYALAHPFVSGLQYSSLPLPFFAGPQLDVAIFFWCSGLQGVKLFQIFFILMLVVDWSVLNRRRALIGYFAGLAFMVMANVVRITLLVIAGNSFPQFVAHHHVTAGWIFFTLALGLYITLGYGWLTATSKAKASVGTAALVQTSQ
jgi:exosortase/archaeosortase family protein